MRKRVLIVVLSVLALLTVIFLVWFYIFRGVDKDLRVGIYTRDFQKSLLVEKKIGEGRPMYVAFTDKDKYPETDYYVTMINENKGLFNYMVGYFWSLEPIEGSKDQLLLVKNGYFGGIKKFRVAGEKSVDWENQYTGVYLQDKQNKKTLLGSFDQIEKKKINELFKKGRKVMVKAGFFPPNVVRTGPGDAVWIIAIIFLE